MVTSAADRTVFVVDDDEAALHSLCLLLRINGLPNQGYSSAGEFLDALSPDTRGCVITDLRMPEVDGVQLIRKLKSMGSVLPVIVITGHADISNAVDAMKAGATDFVEKPYESELILRLVRAALEQNDDAMDANSARTRVRARMASLTSRERQVLDLVVEGASNKMIAAGLGISPRTVEIYRASVMSKMRADSLSELVRMSLAASAA